MQPWNGLFEENPILTTVILLLLLIVLGVVIDPELAGLEGLAASTAP
jgi:uncharacterized membrane protein